MKKGLRAVFAVILCIVCSGTLFACTPKDNIDSSKVTVLSVLAGGGGTGTAWIEEAQERFEKYTEENEISYAEGKVGVKFRKLQTNSAGGGELANWRSSALTIYGVDRQNSLAAEARSGSIVSIDDVIRSTDASKNFGETKSVHEKLDPTVRTWYQSEEASTIAPGEYQYYGIPYLENYAGLSYNRYLFDLYGFYFADDPDDGVPFEAEKYGKTVYFVGPGETENKSCGPDGKKGTNDDGMPSSLVEFLCLCEYMKNAGIDPINLTGRYKQYTNFLQDGMLPSLIGYDRYRNIVYESDSKGEEVEIVVGFDSTQNLFPGIDYIKKPITDKVVITPSCGYYSTWMIEKFYVDALLEIIEKENYFYTDAKRDNATHLDAQAHFLGYDNATVGMLIEASYWNYESVLRGNYKDIGKEPTDPETDVRWMPFPVTLFDTVENDTDVMENGRVMAQPVVLYEYNSSYLCISARYKNNPEVLNAAKDFIRFLMTDAELSHWTVSNFSFKPLDYEITAEDREKMLPFYDSIYKLRDDDGARVLHNWSESPIFRKEMNGLYTRGWGSGQFGTAGNTNMLAAMRSQKYTSIEAFINQLRTADSWSTTVSGITIDNQPLTVTRGPRGDFDSWRRK